jgi:uncharacterized protein YukE
VVGVTSLAPFAHDWVGGDIHGLSALAGQCLRIAPQISQAESALTASADDLTCTAGWQGAAARAFSVSWARDSAAGRQLVSTWAQIGAVVDVLAAELAALENVLEHAASEVEAAGLVIDPGTGIPEPTVTAAGGPAAARIGRLLGEYGKLRAAILVEAKAARAAAAARLQALGAALLPPAKSGPLASNGPGPLITGGNMARSLWAVPTKFRLAAEDELPALEENLQQAQQAAVRDLMAARRLFGKGAAMPADTRDQLAQATEEYNELQAKINSATRLESTSTKVAAGDVDGLGLDGTDSLAGTVVEAVPWLGAEAGTYLTIAQDLQRGESVAHATADGVISTSTGVGTAIGVSSAASGVFDSSLLAAGAETGGVGIVATGAGDLMHHLIQEPWSQDWSKYGAVGGTAHGAAHSASETATDIAGLPGAIIHEGSHLLSGAEQDIANLGEDLTP